MENGTKIGNWILNEERWDEDDNVWFSWELENQFGNSVSSRIWNILNNLRHDNGRRLGELDIISWIHNNVSETDF